MPGDEEIRWERVGRSEWNGVTIDRYLLHHSRYLATPLLHIYKRGASHEKVLSWLGSNGKAAQGDWQELISCLKSGYHIMSLNTRGLGETRMAYSAVSDAARTLAQTSSCEAYMN